MPTKHNERAYAKEYRDSNCKLSRTALVDDSNFGFYDALVNFQRIAIISGYHILPANVFRVNRLHKTYPPILLPGKFYRLNVARFNIAF